MTRVERAAEKLRKERARIVELEREFKARRMEQRTKTRQAEAVVREQARHHENKWRFQVGSLASQAGLRDWPTADLILIFRALASLRDVTQALAVLEAGLGVLTQGDFQGLSDRVTDLSDAWDIPYQNQDLSLHPIKASGSGIVYILQTEESPLLKIGWTANMRLRVKELQTGCPAPLRVLRTYYCYDAELIEAEVHRHLAEVRRHGEWFETDLETVDELVMKLCTPVLELTRYLEPASGHG